MFGCLHPYIRGLMDVSYDNTMCIAIRVLSGYGGRAEKQIERVLQYENIVIVYSFVGIMNVLMFSKLKETINRTLLRCN